MRLKKAHTHKPRRGRQGRFLSAYHPTAHPPATHLPHNYRTAIAWSQVLAMESWLLHAHELEKDLDNKAASLQQIGANFVSMLVTGCN